MSGHGFHVHGPHDHEVEHVAHNGGDAFTSRLAVLTAILSTIGALFGYMGGHSQNNALLYKNEAAIQKTSAANQWNYYQAKSNKQNLAELSISLTSGETQEKYRQEVARYKDEKAEIKLEPRSLKRWPRPPTPRANWKCTFTSAGRWRPRCSRSPSPCRRSPCSPANAGCWSASMARHRSASGSASWATCTSRPRPGKASRRSPGGRPLFYDRSLKAAGIRAWRQGRDRQSATACPPSHRRRRGTTPALPRDLRG